MARKPAAQAAASVAASPVRSYSAQTGSGIAAETNSSRSSQAPSGPSTTGSVYSFFVRA